MTQHATFDREVVPIGIDNEIHRAEMPILEIHRMDVRSSGAVDDATDTCPDACHAAHPTRLQRRIQNRAMEILGLQLLARAPDRHDLRMSGWIVRSIDLVVSLADDGAVQNDNAADRRAWVLATEIQRLSHILFVIHDG